MIEIGRKIRELRGREGMSQQRLAELLGVLRPTISQIENGERKVSVEDLIKLSEIFDLPVGELLDLDKEPEVVLRRGNKEVSQKPVQRLRISVPQKNLKKFREVLLYILNKVGSKPHIGETVIYKLLYFIDFNYYEKYEEQLIGATYIKNRYGPTPVEFKKIVDRMMKDRELMRVDRDYFKYPQTKYLPLREPDLSTLTANEVKVIDDVLNKLSDMNASQISSYSHNDVPWQAAENRQPMEYESVFYRTPAYSVRDDEDIS
jgi:transcriptional regulator with XRE-family HTH domain